MAKVFVPIYMLKYLQAEYFGIKPHVHNVIFHSLQKFEMKHYIRVQKLLCHKRYPIQATVDNSEREHSHLATTNSAVSYSNGSTLSLSVKATQCTLTTNHFLCTVL